MPFVLAMMPFEESRHERFLIASNCSKPVSLSHSTTCLVSINAVRSRPMTSTCNLKTIDVPSHGAHYCVLNLPVMEVYTDFVADR